MHLIVVIICCWPIDDSRSFIRSTIELDNSWLAIATDKLVSLSLARLIVSRLCLINVKVIDWTTTWHDKCNIQRTYRYNVIKRAVSEWENETRKWPLSEWRTNEWASVVGRDSSVIHDKETKAINWEIEKERDIHLQNAIYLFFVNLFVYLYSALNAVCKCHRQTIKLKWVIG